MSNDNDCRNKRNSCISWPTSTCQLKIVSPYYTSVWSILIAVHVFGLYATYIHCVYNYNSHMHKCAALHIHMFVKESETQIQLVKVNNTQPALCICMVTTVQYSGIWSIYYIVYIATTVTCICTYYIHNVQPTKLSCVHSSLDQCLFYNMQPVGTYRLLFAWIQAPVSVPQSFLTQVLAHYLWIGMLYMPHKP